MSGEFGSGPAKKKLPYGVEDVVQPFEAPEHFDEDQLRDVQRAVDSLTEECGLRSLLIEDRSKRPGSFLIQIQGKKQDIDVFRRRLAELKFDS